MRCADNIISGFYPKLRLYILPFLPHKFRERVVLFPNIEPLTREYLASRKNNFSQRALEVFNHYTEKYFEKYRKRVEGTQKHWDGIEKSFINLVYKKFPQAKRKIVIKPSIFGTTGQYYRKYGAIYVFPRFDRTTEAIGKLIILGIVHDIYYPNTLGVGNMNHLKRGIWIKKQKHATRIFRSEPFKSFFNDIKGYEEMIGINFAGNLAEKSSAYLKELNLPVESELLTTNTLKGMSPREKRILKCLMEKKNKVVSFDMVAKSVWPDCHSEKFSLYAIAKHIERIRYKLQQNAIETNIIHTQRGKGYILYD